MPWDLVALAPLARMLQRCRLLSRDADRSSLLLSLDWQVAKVVATSTTGTELESSSDATLSPALVYYRDVYATDASLNALFKKLSDKRYGILLALQRGAVPLFLKEMASVWQVSEDEAEEEGAPTLEAASVANALAILDQHADARRRGGGAGGEAFEDAVVERAKTTLVAFRRLAAGHFKEVCFFSQCISRVW